jgi:hypothetical protein
MPETFDLYDFPTPPLPPPLDTEARGALSAAKVYVTQGEPIPAGVITLKIRARLIARRVALEEAMRPGTIQEIAQLWSTMVEMRGVKAGSAAEARGLANRRAQDLSGCSLWAVCEAVAAYRRGQIGAGSMRPQPGMIGAEARRREAPLVRELVDLRLVLNAPTAPEPTEDDAARKRTLAASLRELANKLRGK